jgi:DedD protein
VAAEAEQRGKLIRQMIYAACAVGVLLGILVFFNYLSSTPEKPEAPTFTEPVPVPPKTPQIRPVTPAETSVETPPENPDGAPNINDPLAPEGQQPAVLTEQPGGTPTPPVSETPPVGNVPASAQASVPTPAQAQTTPTTKPPVSPTTANPPARPPTIPAAPPAEDVPELTAPPSVVLPPTTQPATPPLVSPAEPAQPSASPPAVIRPATGFVVQAGVFTNPQHAEDIYAKLVQNGIPATLETRVQVGPFKTQAEAQAVRAKMKALGIEAVVLPPPSGR